MRLLIGNKNYSSWSLRPWLAMRTAGIAFEEEVYPLDTPEFRAAVGGLSPSGKVPVLVDGDVIVWESLAILEYLAERFPAAGLWPQERAARAHARAIASEMHAGFVALRRSCPMNMHRARRPIVLGADASADVARIDAMWRDCRARFGGGGPFLFGSFTAADAMYAPVVSRFATYAVPVSAPAQAYMQAIMALPAWREWREAAVREPWLRPKDELDWPEVPRDA